MNSASIHECDECRSMYLAATSQMSKLCPECAHHLYGYCNCDHLFVDGRCRLCHWDGSVSQYIQTMKNNAEKQFLFIPERVKFAICSGDSNEWESSYSGFGHASCRCKKSNVPLPLIVCGPANHSIWQWSFGSLSRAA